MQKSMPSIANFYKNRSVFITGATGFLGKTLVEKLLRSCSGIENIYMLIRPSKRESPEERIQQMLQSSIFSNHVKTGENSISKKLIAIPGDIAEERLGISSENEQILSEKVSVVFHMAATIKFNERMKTALKLNLEGTRNALSLSRSMKNLSSVVYVSTAFSNAERNKTPIEEIVYPLPFDSDSCYKFFEDLDQLQILDSITPKLLKEKPNTYVFSKHLAENLVKRKASEWNLPICIVRPSVVAPIHKDPVEMKGWVDNINGLMVPVYGVGHGITYISPGGHKNNVDLMPVDYVVKIMILAAWNTAMAVSSRNLEDGMIQSDSNNTNVEACARSVNKTNCCKVYNACVDQFNRITHGQYTEYMGQSLNTTPLSWLIVPPSIRMTRRNWWKNINSILIGVPCTILDVKLQN